MRGEFGSNCLALKICGVIGGNAIEFMRPVVASRNPIQSLLSKAFQIVANPVGKEVGVPTSVCGAAFADPSRLFCLVLFWFCLPSFRTGMMLYIYLKIKPGNDKNSNLDVGS